MTGKMGENFEDDDADVDVVDVEALVLEDVDVVAVEPIEEVAIVVGSRILAARFGDRGKGGIVKSSASSREETVVAGVIKSLVVAVAARSTSEPSSGSVVDIFFSFKLDRDNKV